ncbi:unnamed protein product, partial [Didymodactylos carnosus]
MDTNNVVQKFKYIVSYVPCSKTIKHELELVLGQYSDDDPDELPKLVNQLHNVLTKNKEKISKTSTQIGASDLVKSSSRTINKATSQQLLNAIVEEFDILLGDALPTGDDLCQFNDVKDKLRELFNNLMKQNHVVQNQITGLEARLSSLEELETDSNIIMMGNIGLQLRNKLIRFIKPDLSYRTARDEHLSMLQTEERYQELTNFIKGHDSNVKISDLARCI